MIFLVLVQLLGASYSSFHEEGHKIQLGTTEEREGRSLLNSFPFTEADPRPAKQYNDESLVDFNSVADASASGQRCIDKVRIEGRNTEKNIIHSSDYRGGGDRI